MPHELTIREDGRAEMFYYGDKPWHGLGTFVDHVLTGQEAIKEAGLDWEVGKQQLYKKIKIGEQELFGEAPAYLTYRKDNNKELGVVGENYQIIQNYECFSFLDSLVQTAEAKYHTAGSIKDGRRIWILLQLPDTLKVVGDDVVDKYLLLVNSHDGKMSMRVMFTPIRVVCMNTLMSAMKSAQVSVKIKHNGKIEEKINEARKTLGLANRYFTEKEQIFRDFAYCQLRDNELNKYYDALFPSDDTNIRDLLKRLYYEGAGHEYSEGTLWGAYNSVIEYVDHHRTNYDKTPDRYLGGVLFGSGLQLKTKAYEKAIEVVYG